MYKVGQKVHFGNCDEDQIENGIVKSTEGNIFVVFNCNDDWDNYKNYTGQSCGVNQLKVGWCGFTPVLFNPLESNGGWYYRFNNPNNGIGYNSKSDAIVEVYHHSNNWNIEHLSDNDCRYMIYHGKIPNNRFAFHLFKNLGLLTEEDEIRINRELSIEEL